MLLKKTDEQLVERKLHEKYTSHRDRGDANYFLRVTIPCFFGGYFISDFIPYFLNHITYFKILLFLIILELNSYLHYLNILALLIPILAITCCLRPDNPYCRYCLADEWKSENQVEIVEEIELTCAVD